MDSTYIEPGPNPAFTCMSACPASWMQTTRERCSTGKRPPNGSYVRSTSFANSRILCDVPSSSSWSSWSSSYQVMEKSFADEEDKMAVFFRGPRARAVRQPRIPGREPEGPDDGPKKQKPFLRPVEILQLLSCEAIRVASHDQLAIGRPGASKSTSRTRTARSSPWRMAV